MTSGDNPFSKGTFDAPDAKLSIVLSLASIVFAIPGFIEIFKGYIVLRSNTSRYLFLLLPICLFVGYHWLNMTPQGRLSTCINAALLLFMWLAFAWGNIEVMPMLRQQ